MLSIQIPQLIHIRKSNCIFLIIYFSIDYKIKIHLSTNPHKTITYNKKDEN